jgi:S1-C subfamily serine protease
VVGCAPSIFWRGLPLDCKCTCVRVPLATVGPMSDYATGPGHLLKRREKTLRRTLLFALALLSGFKSDIGSAAGVDSTVCLNGSADAAIAACTRLISTGTKSATELALAYSYRGLHLIEKREYDRALADYNAATKLDPNSSLPYSGRGIIYLERGDVDRAIVAMTEAIRLSPQYPTDYTIRGDAYLRKGQRDLALRDYNSAIKLNPNHVLAYSGRGEVHYLAGNYDRAIEDLGVAIRFDPKDARPYLFRGRSFSKKGEYDRAIFDLNAAITLKTPHVALAHLALGDAYENRGDFKKALSEYEAASNLDPQSGLAKEAAVAIQRIGKKAATQNATGSPKAQSTGSGFAVNKDGYVLTNHHVIEGCSKVQLRWSNGANETSIVGFDEVNDLAILRSDRAGRAPLTFRDGRGIRQAESVIAIGFPLTGVLATSSKVSIGSVSALAGLGDDTRFLQISAPIQPGNSGGPLLDLSGNVVGVVMSTINALTMVKATGSIPQNVNFAIKSSIVREFLEAKNVAYETATSNTKLDPADVAEKGVQSTVLVECYK